MGDFTTVLLAMLGGTASALFALTAVMWAERHKPTTLPGTDLVAPCVFLFRNGVLVDATPPARAIMAGSSPDLGALKRWLAQRFEGLDSLDDMLSAEGRAELHGGLGAGTASLRLTAEETPDGALRLSLVQPDGEGAGIIVDSLSQQALEEELSMLRGIVDDAPMLISRRDADGHIVWANRPYLQASDRQAGDVTLWPLPDVLDMQQSPMQQNPGPEQPERARMVIENEVHWFDCHEHANEVGKTIYAMPADAEVRAEQSLREYLQTLTKTFADLPIGLAIFDSDRQLQLFNPALVDLTKLSAGFLTSRPSLYSFLDQLRELRMIPEPRDYRSWRKQIAALETAASSGHHAETWPLPGGQTYRVTGRPHPGGAVAFLFEDITAEMSITRSFRAEVSLGAQILDALDDALIVFNAVGHVMASNKAYKQLWGDPPQRLQELLTLWKGDWAEAPGLNSLENSLSQADLPETATGVIFGPTGEKPLRWRVSALPGGKRMLRFTKLRDNPATQGDTPPSALSDLSSAASA